MKLNHTYLLFDGTSQDYQFSSPSIIGKIAKTLESSQNKNNNNITTTSFYSKGIARFPNNPLGRKFGTNIEALILHPALKYINQLIEYNNKNGFESRFTFLGYSRGADIAKRIIYQLERDPKINSQEQIEQFVAIDSVDITGILPFTNFLGIDLNREYELKTRTSHYKALNEKRSIYLSSNIVGEKVTNIWMPGYHESLGGGVTSEGVDIESKTVDILEQEIMYKLNLSSKKPEIKKQNIVLLSHGICLAEKHRKPEEYDKFHQLTQKVASAYGKTFNKYVDLNRINENLSYLD